MTDFATSTDRLLNQIRHWEQSRWSVVTAAGPTRADLVFGLVQQLADLGADAAGEPRRPVPREHDMILPDQLRVMADDLLATGAVPPAAGAAVDAVRPLL